MNEKIEEHKDKPTIANRRTKSTKIVKDLITIATNSSKYLQIILKLSAV